MKDAVYNRNDPRGVLLAGKWSTAAQLDAQTADDIRKGMITVLHSNSRDAIDSLQGWDNDTLVGKLAVLAILQETKWVDLAPGGRLPTTDDHRNGLIANLAPRLHRDVGSLQGESNQALALLALPWAVLYGKYPDWMKNCANWMQDIPLCRLPLPGSHDAGSYGGINLRSKTQEKTVTGQLNAGVRFFDFRLRIDSGEYFSHHNLDESRDNPYLHVPWNEEYEKARNSLFYQIREFCKQHPTEIVILSLYDFTAVPGQRFNEGDALRLISGIIDCFGSLLIPRPAYGKGIPTYRECMANKQQVLVIIDDHPEKDKFPTAVHSVEVWKQSECFRERFSEKGYINWTWDQMVQATIDDQQDYLLLPTTQGGRDPELFWVSQAVLGYNNLSTPDGQSQNYVGSSKLNPPIIEKYKEWWHYGVLPPNILLMDFSGIHDDFASVCQKLLQDDGGIRGILLVGKFRTQQQLNGMSPDGQRNTLITELVGRTKDTVGQYQSLNDADIAGAGALLVYLRETGSRTDQQIKTMSADDMRNTVIVEVAAQTGRDLQALSNMDVMKLVLEWPTKFLH